MTGLVTSAWGTPPVQFHFPLSVVEPNALETGNRLDCGTQYVPLGNGKALLTVAAVPGQRKVVAHLPDGRQERLSYDPFRRRWFARVATMSEIRKWKSLPYIEIQRADGTVAWRLENAPAPLSAAQMWVVAPRAVEAGAPVTIEVESLVPIKGAKLHLEGSTRDPVAMRLDPNTGRYTATVTAPGVLSENALSLRIEMHPVQGSPIWEDLSIPAAVGAPSHCRPFGS